MRSTVERRGPEPPQFGHAVPSGEPAIRAASMRRPRLVKQSTQSIVRFPLPVGDALHAQRPPRLRARRRFAIEVRPPTGSPSRDVLLDVLRQDLVDQRLVAHLLPLCLFAEPIQDVWIQADGDQPTCCVTERWATHPTHRAELLVRRLGNVREVNPPDRPRTRLFPCRSPASR
jgi:hypothetical protein